MRVLAVVGLSLPLVACSGLMAGPSAPPTAVPAGDPTPLTKCKIAASSSSPLVTEWPASEKAHLQSLAASHLVAVEYSGCEMHIVDGCALPGSYRWQRTTLATDTVDIADDDELYAKLPIGAVGLEGELARSGRLAVRTTVAGQLTSSASAMPASLPGACARATHYVSAISVGAFKLLSGANASAGGGVAVAGAGVGARQSNSQNVLRSAGIEDSCERATDAAPEAECASPIQVFLQPLAPSAELAPTRTPSARDGAVQIAFPAPADSDDTWTLRDRAGSMLCTLPCSEWVPPVSGYYLQREKPHAELRLPASFAHKPGTSVNAEYQTGRGNPTLATLTFYGAGIPTGALGVGLLTWGIVQTGCTADPNDPTHDCFPNAGFLIGTGAFFIAAAGASAWWYFWSRDEKFDTYEHVPAPSAAIRPTLRIAPGFVSGTF